MKKALDWSSTFIETLPRPRRYLCYWWSCLGHCMGAGKRGKNAKYYLERASKLMMDNLTDCQINCYVGKFYFEWGL